MFADVKQKAPETQQAPAQEGNTNGQAPKLHRPLKRWFVAKQ
jgi:hypothetical protein